MLPVILIIIAFIVVFALGCIVGWEFEKNQTTFGCIYWYMMEDGKTVYRIEVESLDKLPTLKNVNIKVIKDFDPAIFDSQK